MKNVIIYSRVSTQEQADHGFSLNDQECRMEQYCKIQGYNILMKKREDASAKTFERPEFNFILNYIKTNKGAVHKIIVIKWDRFSRNATDALNMLRKLKGMQVEVNAVEQPIDLTVPENKLMLSFYLTAPEVENDRRAMNVVSGMRRANREGRYLGPAPRGFDNSRDEKDKPILVHDNNAKYIREAFELMAEGKYTQSEVIALLKEKGFSCSRSQFSLLLQNKLYSGKVFVRGSIDTADEWVNGIHEPIVSEELFNKVQDVLTSRQDKTKRLKVKSINSSFPLRGFVLCPS
ncbi:MAG: recombinase family protein, partial [Bacteroidota bacterium]